MMIFILGIAFPRKPLAIAAAVLTGLSIAFLNDCFAVTFNEKVKRAVRLFSPHLAAKLRPPITPVIHGRPSTKRAIHICGRPCWVFVVVFSGASFCLWFTSCRLLTILWALSVSILAIFLHASFRTPNLKARLNTFCEEFCAVWRNYSAVTILGGCHLTRVALASFASRWMEFEQDTRRVAAYDHLSSSFNMD